MSYVAHYHGSRRQNWTTPRAMFDALNAQYSFTLDGASEDGNALVDKYLTGDDILVSWAGERVFCNPPWSRCPEFVELAAFAELAVLLVPARVNARWFHRALELGAAVRFFLGRPSFGDGKGSSPIDCLLLVFPNESSRDRDASQASRAVRGRPVSEPLPAAALRPPDYMSAFDGGEWSYYVAGHDPDELHVIDDPAELTFERLWMRAIPASQAEDFGVLDDDSDDYVLRDRESGRFVARMIWIECGKDAPNAKPFMGARYAS